MAKATKTIRLPINVARELEEYENQSVEVEKALVERWERMNRELNNEKGGESQ